MPGPMLSIALERTAGFGWLAGPLVVLGHGILEFFLVCGVILGLGRIVSAPLFTGVVGITGGIFLVWMAIGVIRNAGNTTVCGNSGGESRGVPVYSPLTVTVSGVTTSLSNPYWLLWWGTVGAGYITYSINQQGLAGLGAFYAGHVLADFAWFTAVAVLMATGGRKLPQILYTNLLRTLGLFLLFMAGYFIFSGTYQLACV